MNTLRLGSGRQFRSAALIEMPLPLAYDPALLPGARILAEDGQIYESMRDQVTGLYAWKVRAQGERGPALELQKSATHIQWRVQGNTGPWFDLVPLEELLGPQGEQGEQGPQGAGLSFQGSVATAADLPASSTLGYGFLVQATTPPRLYLYNGTTWVDAGPIQGPKGDQGDPGDSVELQKTSTEIQWRRIGAATWTTLVLLADLKGDDGASVELRKTSTEIQWRLEGAATWITLVPLDDIKGPVGDTGDQGNPGNSFSYQGTVATVAALPTPSTAGFAFKVLTTGDLHIYNGTAWVNAGPLQGPKGDPGDTGPAGPVGPGFSYQGTVATVAALPSSSTAGFALKVLATGDLHIYNGTAWVNAGPLQGPKGDPGDKGDTGNQGIPGSGFSYQGTVASVAALPTPSTQGYGFKVLATGDLHIYNGTAWVNAGPLQGPKGDQGDQGIQGIPGPGFNYQGSLANVGLLPIPSTQGYAYRVGTDLWIYNGSSWVNAGPLQGPKGDTGDQGLKGDPGSAATIALGTVTTGTAGSSVSITNVGTPSNAVLNITIPRGDKGDQGNPGVVTASAPLIYNASTQALSISAATTSAAGSMSAADKARVEALGTSGTPQFAGLGLGTAAVAGWDLVIADSLCQHRVSVTAVSSTYSLDVQVGNEFITAAAINGATTINLSSVASIPAGYLWRGVLTFAYTSGTISWFTGNSGYTVKWDGGSAMTPTANETEKVVIEVVGGTTTIEIAPLKGRA